MWTDAQLVARASYQLLKEGWTRDDYDKNGLCLMAAIVVADRGAQEEFAHYDRAALEILQARPKLRAAIATTVESFAGADEQDVLDLVISYNDNVCENAVEALSFLAQTYGQLTNETETTVVLPSPSALSRPRAEALV